jgi:hypothetical protein
MMVLMGQREEGKKGLFHLIAMLFLDPLTVGIHFLCNAIERLISP